VDQWFWSLFPAGIRLPDPATARGYAQNVPDDFVFTVTHVAVATALHHPVK
jgi:hypothetical protein